jgi:hypothetical protein
MNMDMETMQTYGTNGLADRGSKETTKKGPKTRRQKIEDGLERVELAVAELVLAVDVATKFDVPGFDLGATLAADLGPVLGKIGYEIRPAKKVRGAKA